MDPDDIVQLPPSRTVGITDLRFDRQDEDFAYYVDTDAEAKACKQDRLKGRSKS